jgi:hypothetical protein
MLQESVNAGASLNEIILPAVPTLLHYGAIYIELLDNLADGARLETQLLPFPHSFLCLWHEVVLSPAGFHGRDDKIFQVRVYFSKDCFGMAAEGHNVFVY